MRLAAVFSRHRDGDDGAIPRNGLRRGVVTAWSLAASIALHCAALAFVVGWSGDHGETLPVPAVDVTLLSDAVPDAAEPFQPTLPPSASPPSELKPQPAPHRVTARSAKPGVLAHLAQTPEPTSSSTDRTAETSDASSANGLAAGGADPVGGAGPPGNGSDTAATPSAGNPAPVYPISARHAGREGRTTLLVVVTPTGECGDVSVEETSGTPSLDEAAMAAVRRWRFSPAIRAGRKSQTTVRVPITFKLTDASS